MRRLLLGTTCRSATGTLTVHLATSSCLPGGGVCSAAVGTRSPRRCPRATLLPCTCRVSLSLSFPIHTPIVFMGPSSTVSILILKNRTDHLGPSVGTLSPRASNIITDIRGVKSALFKSVLISAAALFPPPLLSLALIIEKTSIDFFLWFVGCTD